MYRVQVSGSSEEGSEEIKKTATKLTFEDLVPQGYHILEQIHNYENEMSTWPGIPVHFPGREKLKGFAFMDIVDVQNDLRPRIGTFKKTDGVGWTLLEVSGQFLTRERFWRTYQAIE